ncbi:S8 family peptidase [Phytomonospora endophytica]|uniref:P/Homo B domain-containing protein n=1 Tax=Phytomonospora endophytica TaxID=714109 RepID=A0A841FZJ7_9ACTN|nr:S8 family peptidase [Phytomonospora endophytica]MBB6038807.1 hypothetical protein [Phytomonospora endophytica]GIG68397.1 serine protease [Phytomonospora endophytica]
MSDFARSLVRAVCALLLAAAAFPAAGPAAAAPADAPLYTDGTADVPGRYIVVLKPSVSTLDAPTAAVTAAGGTVRHRYRAAFQGFSADLPPAALDGIRKNPDVDYVQSVRVHRQEDLAGGGTQPGAPWHLDRIDQRQLPLDGNYGYADDADEVRVYVLDTGVRATHTEFEGRASGVYTSINDGNGTNDCHGHGTFVSSHIAGKTYGAAKKASIKAVRILDCGASGTTEQIVDGMDWTADNAVLPAVANMSVQSSGGNADRVMDTAAKGMIDKGILLVLIAGNFNKGDCQNSPKDARAIIMAASTRTDSRNTGTNASSYGSCVTAFAPGANVTGAGRASDTATQSGWYGTSFAAPLAAGAVALDLEKNPSLTMAQAKDHVITNATTGLLTDIGTGSPNRLLYTGPGSTGGCAPVTNPTDVPIADLATADSPVTVSGCTGAAATSTVAVDIVHTYRGDLVVSLIAPDGTARTLHNRTGGSADNLKTTYTVDLSSEARNGTWTLRVRDAAANDSGYVNSWTLTL